MIVLMATLPARHNTSACNAMLIVPRVTDQTLMTVMCVKTRKLSVTTESVYISVPTTHIMMRLPMNAEVGKLEVCFLIMQNRMMVYTMNEILDHVFIVPGCDRSCLTCSGHEPSSCLSCDANRRKDASGHCVWFMECPMLSYMDQKLECKPCHKSCHRCSGPGQDHCLSCNEPNFLLSKLIKVFLITLW